MSAELTLVSENRPVAVTANPLALPAAQMSFTEMQQAAKMIAASGLFAAVKTPEAAMTLMMLCQSEGLHPVQALRRYHIVQGQPTMKAEAMQAEFQARGGVITWHDWNDDACSATFSHPSAPEPVKVEWTIARAKKAGLPDKNPQWTKYPRNMLKARVISDGVRLVLPGAILGLYTPEEAEDIAADRPRPTGGQSGQGVQSAPTSHHRQPSAAQNSNKTAGGNSGNSGNSAGNRAGNGNNNASASGVDEAGVACRAFANVAESYGWTMFGNRGMLITNDLYSLADDVRGFLNLPVQDSYNAEEWKQLQEAVPAFAEAHKKPEPGSIADAASGSPAPLL